jgi:hypothetical protein
VDVERLLARVDVDGILARVDVNAIIDRVPVDELAQRAGIPEIVSDSTSHMAASFIDLLRRQGVGLDLIIFGVVQRLLRRRVSDLPSHPTLLVNGEGP